MGLPPTAKIKDSVAAVAVNQSPDTTLSQVATCSPPMIRSYGSSIAFLEGKELKDTARAQLLGHQS